MELLHFCLQIPQLSFSIGLLQQNKNTQQVIWCFDGDYKHITKKKLMAPFYWWGSTASGLEPLRGGSLLFTTKFPTISGTHFTDLGRMKGVVDPGAAQWFWTRDHWIRNPASFPLGYCSKTEFNEVNKVWSTEKNIRGVFTALPNIYDGVFAVIDNGL